MTDGVPSSTIATHELVVPRSIPITLSLAMAAYFPPIFEHITSVPPRFRFTESIDEFRGAAVRPFRSKRRPNEVDEGCGDDSGGGDVAGVCGRWRPPHPRCSPD